MVCNWLHGTRRLALVRRCLQLDESHRPQGVHITMHPYRCVLQIHVQAVVVLKGDSSVSGTVTFEQSTASGEVTVKGDLKGLDPSSSRGFHIQYVPNYLQLLWFCC